MRGRVEEGERCRMERLGRSVGEESVELEWNEVSIYGRKERSVRWRVGRGKCNAVMRTTEMVGEGRMRQES